jgi:hypothetical protein
MEVSDNGKEEKRYKEKRRKEKRQEVKEEIA